MQSRWRSLRARRFLQKVIWAATVFQSAARSFIARREVARRRASLVARGIARFSVGRRTSGSVVTLDDAFEPTGERL